MSENTLMGNFARMAAKIQSESVDSIEHQISGSPNADSEASLETSAESASAGHVMVSRIAESEADKDARIIAIKLIDPDPDQPRVTFSDIEEKAETIKEHGLLHAIVVRPHPEVPGRFMIIDGERRWRAYSEILFKQDPLEFSEIRATVKADVNDIGKLRLMQLLANIQRDDLNPIEEAEALATIKQLNGYGTNKELAKAVGKSETRVSRSLKLLQLSQEERGRVVSGELSVREIQNHKGVEAARDGSADKGVGDLDGKGEGSPTPRIAKVSISMDTANHLALLLQIIAEKNGLAGVALSDMSKKELVTVLEARAGDILASI